MTWQQEILELFKTTRMRVTQPRRTIVGFMADRTDPFTAEELVEELPKVGRSTIYRTIEVLLEHHWLARIHRDDGEHAYTPTHPHKHHLRCTSCGKKVSFETCDLDGLLLQLAQKTGFHVQGHTLEAFGLCQHCQSR